MEGNRQELKELHGISKCDASGCVTRCDWFGPLSGIVQHHWMSCYLILDIIHQCSYIGEYMNQMSTGVVSRYM